MNLEETIQKRRNNLRADRLDMSFGELMNIYEDNSLVITPEYQRTFRWDVFQQTRFIESILLGIPVPPIFVAEDDKGKWELVDGLQRISTIFSFFGLLTKNETKNNLILEEGDLITELKSKTVNDIGILLKNSIKRSVCRVEIIKWDSDVDMRYELFNRLNTGGSPLSEQEIRNCIFRGHSNELNSLLIDIGTSELFKDIIKPTDKQIEEMFCEELVLRFYTFKNDALKLEKNLPNHLSSYMRRVAKQEISFNKLTEKEVFEKYINYLNDNFDHTIFRASNGIFTPNYFDAIMLSLNKYWSHYENNSEAFRNKIDELKSSPEYKEAGLSAYSQSRIESRVLKAFEIFNPNGN